MSANDTFSSLLRRPRVVHAALLAVTVVLGLVSRRIPELPHWLAKYPGDVLYATMAYWLARLIAPRWPAPRAALAAVLWCFAVEASQLYHAPWLEEIRAHTLGGLVLGHAFHATDLVCYLVGTALGLAIDPCARRPQT
jgi:hypothetical protein